MFYDDVIYGTIRIEEPVLLDLMNSAALRRLHTVLQHGISGLIGITNATTRYDHSMGVMILASRLGAPLEEQIAALLHDVSHTAFSHVIDYVFDGHDSQSYHDEMKETYIAKTELPAVLARHGYDWRDFLDESRFPILEQPAPALCADRLDYFLHDSVDLGLATVGEASHALAHLVVHDGRIAVDDLDVARWLGVTYLAADDASWANFDEVGIYELTAQAIRYALDTSILTQDDLWGNDQELWAKMWAAGDENLLGQLERIKPTTRFIWDEINPDFRVSTKLRTIDPDLLVGGELRPLSQLDDDFNGRRNDYLQGKKGKWPMRVISSMGENDDFITH
jgi:HD superfamily phosphohydrolase